MSRVCVFLADGFEEIEGLTVVDLLRRAGIETDTVSIMKRKEVNGAHNIIIMSDKLYEEVDYNNYDMLVLPGGMPGTLNLGSHKSLAALLKQFASEGKNISAICAAPSVLGDNGILKGKRAVCYPGFEERLAGAVVSNEKTIVDGNIITGKAMGTAIDFGLAIIEKLINQETANKIKASICYNI
ncbi:4-methyl-5(b-hydroxyethyl)-thiazole monophosphate biosynthesis [Lachnotalea glycerini]|uniref:4-methyl-5(B-hydroxyethyl)-thiazole monophosphate biosynthesis n=1 Tax=Lachnotalea glycerini TaxID=1763509 RepID=A0A255I5A3_9FIRM|nr:DJ-1 family glyoxalase III [Lachnotalea glycerini]PXV89105.1 4-methyl-5(b-hydroxyethyl)-thiazole monophosphate biosynthesis [Lachnotalea glycerini]RDY30504.1 DJ-1 family protein [Lachnotalea glycerini]